MARVWRAGALTLLLLLLLLVVLLPLYLSLLLLLIVLQVLLPLLLMLIRTAKARAGRGSPRPRRSAAFGGSGIGRIFVREAPGLWRRRASTTVRAPRGEDALAFQNVLVPRPPLPVYRHPREA